MISPGRCPLGEVAPLSGESPIDAALLAYDLPALLADCFRPCDTREVSLSLSAGDIGLLSSVRLPLLTGAGGCPGVESEGAICRSPGALGLNEVGWTIFGIDGFLLPSCFESEGYLIFPVSSMCIMLENSGLGLLPLAATAV